MSFFDHYDYYSMPQTVSEAPAPIVKARKRRAKKRSVPMSAATKRETATLTAIKNFEKTVKQHAAKKVGNVSEIIQQIETVKKATPSVYDETKIKAFLSQRAKALSVLIDNLIVAKLSSQYPMLDDSIFNLKRHLFFSGGKLVEDRTQKVSDGRAAHVEAQLFVIAGINEKKVQLGKHVTRTGYDYNRQQVTTTITANVPSLPISVAAQGRKALGYYHNALADIYSDELTNDLLSDEVIGPEPTLEVMWIPTTHSLNVKVDVVQLPVPVPSPRVHYDPALILRHKHRYLIGLWEIKDEKPMEGILREFTVGPAKFPEKEKV